MKHEYRARRRDGQQVPVLSVRSTHRSWCCGVAVTSLLLSWQKFNRTKVPILLSWDPLGLVQVFLLNSQLSTDCSKGGSPGAQAAESPLNLALNVS